MLAYFCGKAPSVKKYIFFLLLPFGIIAQNSPFNPAAVFPAKHQFDTGDTLRIMTWNVEHLVDSHDDPYVNNKKENAAEVNPVKMQQMASVLALAKADVVVLQEAESANAIEALSEAYFNDLGYTYFADARSRDWYQNVVIMSKLPLGRISAYGNVHTPVEFEKDGEKIYQTQNYINTRLWTCELLVNENYGIYLNGAHLKAGGGERNRSMRLGQISYWQKEMERILQSDASANILLLGDLNSYRDGAEIEALLNYEHPQVKLQDPLDPKVNTHPADAPKKRLDYLLYNQNLSEEVIANSAAVFKPFGPEEMRQVSDHLPVLIDILLP